MKQILGFMLSHRDTRANLDNCQAVINMRSLTNLKEIQRLIGCIASLTRFLPRIAKRAILIMNLLKKTTKFSWDQECEQAFQDLKLTLSTPPLLVKPNNQKSLIIYLLVSSEAISMTTIQKNEGTQHPIYFIGWMLHKAEGRHQLIKKVALALVQVARWLQQYFQSHQVVVRIPKS